MNKPNSGANQFNRTALFMSTGVPRTGQRLPSFRSHIAARPPVCHPQRPRDQRAEPGGNRIQDPEEVNGNAC
jgi:hypothetical protein